MEEAYRTVGLAILRLVSGVGEEIEHVKNQAILRSVLQHRPVILGYALSTLARRLNEGSACGQHTKVRKPAAGAATADSAAVRVPHTGIRLALEVVLGSFYDPSSPHAVLPIVDALGEDNLEALLLAPGKTGPLLPWAARLCLLHACLAGGCAGGRKWSWLPTVADSASSFALQEIATKGSSSVTGNAVGNGKGRAQASSARGAPPNETGKLAVGADRADSFSAALMAQVCGDLAAVGAAGAGSTPRSRFLASYAGAIHGVGENMWSSACPADLFPGQHIADSFRLKLQTLRDALTSRAESDGRAAEQAAAPTAATAVGDVGLEDLHVHPGVVRRALERSHCGEAFILAVQAALEANVPPTATPKDMDQNASFHSDRRVTLKHALETCLFGFGLPAGGRGLLDAVATDVSEVSFIGGSSSTTATAGTIGTHPSRATPKPPEARQACALIQGLVEEGTRIRDLLLTLLGMHQERDRRRPLARRTASVEPDSSCRWTAAEVVATVHSACEFPRRSVAGVARAFVEWLADTPWVWGATEGVEGEEWEGDFAAAAKTISTVYPSRLAAAGEGIYAAAPIWRVLKTVRGTCPYEQHASGGSRTGDASWGSGLVDPMDVLDRLVASAAMALGHAEADNVEWINVLQRVTAAATATDSLRAYAVACVEKSAALGGQAPFRVAGKRRFSQVRGGQLWGLLEGACVFQGEPLKGKLAPAAVLIRVAATAVTASRKISQSWMISPGLLGSGPIRAVIDMLGAAKGYVTASDLLVGLLQRPGAEGPAVAADIFAAFVAAAAAEGGQAEGGDNGLSDLRSRAMAWLGSALSACYVPVHPPGSLSMDMDSTIVSTALARNLFRRVPFEEKPVLIAVEEAAKLASAGRGGGTCARRSGKRKHVPGRGEGLGGDAAVASLLKVARAAMQSPLLPLPVPVPPSPSRLKKEEGESGGEAPGAGTLPVDDGEEPNKSPARGGTEADAPTASVTARLLLDAFVQSPADVRRSLRQKMHQRDCDNELLAVQRSLRRALCTAPAPPGQDGDSVAADGDTDSGGTATPLLAGLRARKASACMLVGYLVENGVLGWEDTKAAMIPPPPQLLEAAEGGGVRGAGCDHSRRPLTALRLDVWLRSLLCDADNSHFDVGLDIEKSFPDVFRTSRTLARAIARHASALVTGSNQDERAPRPNGYHQPSYSGGDSGGVERLRPNFVNGTGVGDGGGDRRRQEPAVDELLESPRRALAGRLQSTPAAAALVSWVSSVVKTAKQYRQWLPWQPFADELRELVLLSVRQRSVHQAAGGDGGGAGGRALAAEAAVFAVCELLLAWEETPAEVIPTVFQPALCSRALNAAVAPVTPDVRPPIWLEVLRCLVGEGQCDISRWILSDVEGSAQQAPVTVAAAAAVWIGGDGPGAGQSGDRSTREAWVRWYGAKLGSLIPKDDGEYGSWLMLSNASESGVGGVRVRAGVGVATHTVQPEEWQRWGRSPLQAAWNFPGGWGAGGEGSPVTDTEGALPAIVLPSFASWLRVVLRGGPSCPEDLLEAYLLRMAREVYLPCQFGGASGEMARHWLAALIEAEAGAEGRAKKNASMAVVKTESNGGVAVKTEFCPASAAGTGTGTAPARQLVVAAAAPVGGPLTWLWPLEAVVAACQKTGPFGGGMLARRRRGSLGPKGKGPLGDPPASIVVGGPPSALARALCTVPHDLLCGSRRFDSGGGQPPPATATLRAFATRAVDLTARALATPPCRHWSVARRLLLGLGLLYHALAEPGPTRDGASQKSLGAAARAGAVEVVAGHTRGADEDAAADQARAQAAALSAIESLVGIALGLGDDVAGGGQYGGASARVEGEHRGVGGAAGMPGSTAFLTSACRALRPLETGSCAGADDFAEALRGAGAWRAAAAFFGRRKATGTQASAAPLVQNPPVLQTLPSVSSSSSSTTTTTMPRPLSPQVDPQQQHQSLSSPGAMPVVEVDHAVGGHQANGQSTADCCVSTADVVVRGGKRPCSAGGHEVDADSPHAPSFGCPRAKQDVNRQNKKARLSSNTVEGPPRRMLPMTRMSERLRHRDDA